MNMQEILLTVFTQAGFTAFLLLVALGAFGYGAYKFMQRHFIVIDAMQSKHDVASGQMQDKYTASLDKITNKYFDNMKELSNEHTEQTALLKQHTGLLREIRTEVARNSKS